MEALMTDGLIKKWLQHGQSVNYWYLTLYADQTMFGHPEIEEWAKSYHVKDLRAYHFNHDCSKPYIRIIDESGKEHYPNHSFESSKRYIAEHGHDQFADMILHDMDFHTKRGEELKETWSLPYSDDLYFTAWSEIFANAELFGGRESDSFKIKRKRLIKAFKYK